MEQAISIPVAGVPAPGMMGTLSLGADAPGVVLVACSGGSARDEARDRRLAERLASAGFATLLLSPLVPDETDDRVNLCDVHLLAGRLIEAVRWLRRHDDLAGRPVGLLGCGCVAAAALIAAARAAEHDGVGAVVCWEGRPDLAEVWLDGVAAPTLLIASAGDHPLLTLNQQAATQLHCVKALETLPCHEPSTDPAKILDMAIRSARAWFTTHLLAAANT